MERPYVIVDMEPKRFLLRVRNVGGWPAYNIKVDSEYRTRHGIFKYPVPVMAPGDEIKVEIIHKWLNESVEPFEVQVTYYSGSTGSDIDSYIETFTVDSRVYKKP